MKFNIFFTLKGPGGSAEAPNSTNPIEANNLADVLIQLAEQLEEPLFFNLTVVSIRVETIDEGEG